MLIGRSWDELPFLGTFQNGSREELLKIKLEISLSQLIIIIHLQYLCQNICFGGYKHDGVFFKQITQHKKGQNARFYQFHPPILPEIYHLSERIICCIINV